MRYDDDIPDVKHERFPGNKQQQRQEKSFWKKHYRRKQCLREKRRLQKEVDEMNKFGA